MAFYVLDENNNKIPAYDKEGVLAILSQAIEDGSLDNIVADAAFITKLKCCIGGGTYKVAFITQATYNELVAENLITADTYYFITDDTTKEDISKTLEKINQDLNEQFAKLNEVNAALPLFSKKSEARQYLPKNPNFLDYNASHLYVSTATTQIQIDLSSMLLVGKSYADTIGISGSLTISLNADGGQTADNVSFSTLWNNYDAASSNLNLFFTINNKLYCLLLRLGINSNNKLFVYAAAYTAYNITDNTTEDVYSIIINYLNIYYK